MAPDSSLFFSSWAKTPVSLSTSKVLTLSARRRMYQTPVNTATQSAKVKTTVEG